MEQKQESIQQAKDNQFIYVKDSEIHGKGVYTAKDIAKGTKVIEYVGEKISKEEGSKREKIQEEISKQNNLKGAVYIFELNDKYDIDGNFEYNTARLINHSCDPNCEIEIIQDRIWIIAIKDIKTDEEITFNYSFDFDEDYKYHPCKCGSKNCVGYILDEDHWEKLKASS
ncbi:SET domain-containing protein-lysine N-methyltransferase [Candidatus Pacearchaeota archaeon]|nr:SET domain-containing protein-lysine N-methyltransferase [Candidatus Pacearchaeota archaeon]